MKKHSKKQLVSVAIYTLIMVACSHTKNEDDKSEEANLNKQKSRYLQDLEFISKMPRTPGSDHHKAVQNMCADRFNDLGFQVELHDYGSGVNIIGVHSGKQNPTEKILVSAHYDTVPGCNGADDNATGIAGVLETARILASKQHPRTLVVACWDEEERETLGSKEFVAREKNNSSDIKMSYVYEMIGYKNDEPNSQQIPTGFELLYPKLVKQIQHNQNRGDFILLVYDDLATGMLSTIAEHADKQNLPSLQIKVSSNMKSSTSHYDLRRSDHSAFWDADFPAMMITDTANFRNPNYHCRQGADNIESLDIDFAIKTINVISKTIEDNLAQ